MKKFIAAFMAIVMCAALALPALAADATPPNRQVEYTVTTQDPTVDVTIAASGTVILNPYNIKVTNTSLGATNATNSILAAKYYVANKSNVPLKMSMVATGSIPEGSAAKFLAAEPADTEKNRAVFMFIDVGTVTEAAVPTAAALCTATYSAEKVAAGTQGIIKAGDLKMTDVLTIPVPTTAETGNYVPIEIGGKCSTTPTDAWTSADKVGLTVTFTFVATVTSGTGSGSGGGGG